MSVVTESVEWSFAREGELPGEEWDAWVVPAFGDSDEWAASLPEEIRSSVAEARSRGVRLEAKGRVECWPTHGRLPVPYLIVCGFGDGQDGRRTTTRDVRTALAEAGRLAADRKLAALAVSLPYAATVDDGGAFGAFAAFGAKGAREPFFAPRRVEESWPLTVRAAAEGLLLGAYRPPSYRSQADDEAGRFPIRRVRFFVGDNQTDPPSLERAAEAAERTADATAFARDLTNTPADRLGPSELAQQAAELAAEYGFECEVLDEREMRARGMNGVCAVGAGSVRPPRLIALKYRGASRAMSDDVHVSEAIGLVGKGVVFDTGGLCIKSCEGMEEMIGDMGGAAAVLAVCRAIGRWKPPIDVVAVVPAVENMPSGTAFRPGDVIRTYSGKTVEVANTDAEGRIILADAVAYARELGAGRLIEVSTLTGSALATFGGVATPVMSNDAAFLEHFLESARLSGERMWPMPVFDEYLDWVKSDVADVRNLGNPSKWAGAITAALFVGMFAESTPWIHLDIGGTFWLRKRCGTEPERATGAAVRTILYYLERIAEGLGGNTFE